jgi:1-aminocyclopropane-1-carboxylate deaminase/D-cysteine desulfhydrase-like pyridoxal-dependent ACC family enzyme
VETRLKLEYLVAEAQAHGARMLITAGAVQSNHCRQTAAAAARYGFDCLLVLKGDPAPEISGNLLLDHLFGAEIAWTGSNDQEQVLQERFQQAWEAGRRPYLIPYGGSNPTGATAYVEALQELLEQFSSDPQWAGQSLPEWILFASSSGGTQAGLALGAQLFRFPGKILGISVDLRAAPLQARVAHLAGQTAELLGEKVVLSPEEILVNDGYLGGGYGVMGEPEKEAIRLFGQTEGLLLDPVYTGRAAAGLIDLVRQGQFSRDETIVFWHTGGAPALFAEKYRNI